MQKRAGPDWDHIDQSTLEELERSWVNSRCGEVEFDISVSMCACVSVKYRITREITAEGSVVGGTPLWSDN